MPTHAAGTCSTLHLGRHYLHRDDQGCGPSSLNSTETAVSGTHYSRVVGVVVWHGTRVRLQGRVCRLGPVDHGHDGDGETHPDCVGQRQPQEA